MQTSYSVGKKRQHRVYKILLVFCIYITSGKKDALRQMLGGGKNLRPTFKKKRDIIKMKQENNCRGVYILWANTKTAGRFSIRTDSG